jgi:lipopolysaccharide export system permease protein
MRLLSRYLLWQWIRIFVLAAVGFPVVSVLMYLTDRLNRLLDRGLTSGTIALSGIYGLPQNMANMIPAAALFATVFTIGPLSRNSELTAAKAGGISFHRLVMPIFIAAIMAAVATFYISEFATETTARQLELEKERVARNQTTRYHFVFRADDGWVYSIANLDTQGKMMRGLVLERQGATTQYSSLAIAADSASWNDKTQRWTLMNGSSHFLGETKNPVTARFSTLELKSFDEKPRELLIEPKKPEEMRYAELGRYIDMLRRSGNDTKKLVVEKAIKLALPAACLVIALFGAPLAVSNPRAGAAMGIAISLGTTVAYLLMINLSKAVGASGVMDPVLAAWVPNLFFLVIALGLLWKVRT